MNPTVSTIIDENDASDLTVAEWLRRIRLVWELNPAQLAGLLHVETKRVEEELQKSTDEARRGPTIPTGLDTAPALIRIFQLLAARHPEVEAQVKWLFTENQDFGGEKPITVAASSRENLFWIAYYLEGARAANVEK